MPIFSTPARSLLAGGFAVFCVGAISQMSAMAQVTMGGGDATMGGAAAGPPAAYGNLILPFVIMIVVGPLVLRHATGAISNHAPGMGLAFRVGGIVAVLATLIALALLFAGGGRGGLEVSVLAIAAYAVLGAFLFGRVIVIPDADGSGTIPLGTRRGLIVSVVAAAAIGLVFFLVVVLLVVGIA